MNPVTQNPGACPCLVCYQMGTKLTKYGHLVGCTCRACLGRRNRRKGRRSEAKTYKALGGEGQTLKDDLMFTLSLDVAYENKAGAQVPASLRKLVESAWFRRALRQAEKKKPIGTDCKLAVVIDAGRSGRWAVVQL